MPETCSSQRNSLRQTEIRYPKVFCLRCYRHPIESVPCHYLPFKTKKQTDFSVRFLFMLALPIFPGRLQPSIFGAGELNCRVRDGNGWTLTAINTNYLNWLSPTEINYFIIQRSHYAVKRESLEKSGDPCGNRTHVCGVRGRRLSRLTNGP